MGGEGSPTNSVPLARLSRVELGSRTAKMVVAEVADSALWQFDFDPAALHKKYIEERDRRAHKEHYGQYIIIGEGKGERYKEWLTDPWTSYIEREPVNKNSTVLILGAGFSGIMTAAMLKDRGVKDITIIDGAGSFGGTWYWNRYPGAACDSEAYCYLPLLEETGYVPREKYCLAPEIAEHVERIAKKWDLQHDALFHTHAKDFTWDDATKQWTCRTDRGDIITSQFLVVGSGPLNRPKLPNIEGIESFKGHEFHTARWDYKYTGGDAYGNLHKLSDKRVGIIGTGATAVQSIPFLGEYAKELYVFQRTPSTIDVRDNRPTDLAWMKSLKPGWQKERDNAFLVSPTGGEPPLPLDDGFTKMFLAVSSLLRRHLKTGEGAQYTTEDLLQLADYRHLERIRRRVDEVVKDKETAEKLKPWYNILCKRPTFSDTYLPTFNRPNVHLVDTSTTKGIERITEKGIVVDGKEYELDCIIWATGFETHGAALVNKPDYDVIGRDGIKKEDKFKDGIKSLYGMATNGFPNHFWFGIPQAGATLNWTSLTNSQVDWVAYVISEAIKRGAKTVEVTKEAEDGWTKEVVEKSNFREKFFVECTVRAPDSLFARPDNVSFLALSVPPSPSFVAGVLQRRGPGPQADRPRLRARLPRLPGHPGQAHGGQRPQGHGAEVKERS
ncbi:cyclododecanone monooxygenase [Hyaloraphidium curvatum]|nr:cyclododecanone monooxygenase [Hyaloraphidium curvatum]